MIGISSKADLAERVKVLDGYSTPPVAVWGLLSEEPVRHQVWDPCDGKHRISGALEASGRTVFSSDIYRWDSRTTEIKDFFSYEAPPISGEFDVVMNPPYNKGMKFVERALALAPYDCKVIAILRLQFLESSIRKPFFKHGCLERVLVHSKRLPAFHRFSYEGSGDGNAMAYAWYVWRKGYNGPATLDWI